MSLADNHYEKSPYAKLDYSVSWADWLADDETISASEWNIDEGITEVSDSETTTIATVWLSGGVVGTKYTCVNVITTSAGRIDARTIYVTVVAR